MMSEKSFNAYAEALAKANGIPLELAQKYTSRIGDTPELDPSTGKLVVRDTHGHVIATLTRAKY